MEQQVLTEIKQHGYSVAKNIIPINLIDSINSRSSELKAHRGHDFSGKYWAQDSVEESQDLAIWWSQTTDHWQEVNEVNNLILHYIGSQFDQPSVYISDIITNEPGNTFVKPHIDSPYRFDQWHDSPIELLGIQAVIPLCEFSKENGGDGILPGSHRRTWIVKDSYHGVYTQEFLQGCIQPKMSPGDALIYNPRLLHSTMPNHSTFARRALLSHFTDKSMLNSLYQLDNIRRDL